MKKLFSFLSRFYQRYSATIPLNSHHLEQDFDSAEPANFGDASQPITLIRTGRGNDYILQGLTLDHRHKFLYTTHVEGHPEQGVINRFKVHSSNLWSAQDAQKTLHAYWPSRYCRRSTERLYFCFCRSQHYQ